ncbi:MAG TPA: lipocalin family protein [Burkholderiaceae bacterium]|nr:lipocalin family protein [Burkholderiaceae bacterium]
MRLNLLLNPPHARRGLAAAACALALCAAAQAQSSDRAQGGPPPLDAVASVDLARYAGTWHEAAKYPNFFQRKCMRDTTATYTALPEEGGVRRVGVRNVCTDAEGKPISVDGVARVVDTKTNARLAVSFLPSWLRWIRFAEGNYWVVALDADYRWAIVSEPNREYLWVLSRTPLLSAADRETVIARLKQLGFDLNRVQWATSVERGEAKPAQ